jgi:ABC-2 type transport system permease protein
MKTQKMIALVQVELKKMYRDPMNLAIILLMPVGLTLVYYLALGNLYPAWHPPGTSHFEYLVPGTMGYAVIYMSLTVAMGFCTYREAGLLRRLESTPTSPYEYMGSHIIANMFVGVFQALIVLLVSVLLGFRPQGGLPGLVMASIFLALLAVTSVGFGLLTATIAKSANAASGLSMVFVVPMMVFGTLLAVFNDATRAIARFTPNYYVSDSLSLIFNGASLSDRMIWQNLLVLAIISLVVVVAGMQIFKKTEYR